MAQAATANDQLGDLPFILKGKQPLVFDHNKANEILFGGAKGGGKSFLIRYCLCAWCMVTPGLQGYLFRRTFPDLIKNHMEGPTGFPQMLARCIAKKRCVIVGREVRWSNGARIFLNHLQLEKHVTKYQGVEIHVLAMDEWTQFTEYQTRYLLGSVRLGSFKATGPFANRFPIIIGGANPGGIGHNFIKQRFIDHGPPYKIIQHSEKGEGGMRRQFIPARAEDNPELLKSDPHYLERLEGMGHPDVVRAMREGDWEVVADSMFGYIWRGYRHVCKPFPIPVTWDVWRGGDDGFAEPASVHWITQDPDTKTFFVIGELYQRGMLPEEFARRVMERDMTLKLDFGDGVIDTNDLELSGPLDSAAFATTGTGSESRARQMNRLGCKWRPVEKGPGSRAMRVQMLHKVLAPNKANGNDGNGVPYPGIVFFSNCVSAIDTIPKLLIDKNDPEDILQIDDHAFDSITYGLTEKKHFFTRTRITGI